MTDLPVAREPSGPYRIAMICLGNICRSPMAEVVLTAGLADAGLAERVVVDSCGTGAWHTGDPMDERAARALSAHGYDTTAHRAQLFTADWYRNHDLLLAMDHNNHRDVVKVAPDIADEHRVRMFRAYDPEATPPRLDVPDPWYGGEDGFDRTLATVQRTTKTLVALLADV